MKHLLQLLILSALFLVSVWLRYPNKKLLNDLCISESITAHTLTTITIWDQGGIGNYHYSPVFSFNYPLDKETNIFARVIDSWTNDRYYVSYPPFNFYLPYFIFKIINQKPSIIGIRIINLFIHFICGLLIFYLIIWLNGLKKDNLFFLPSYLGFIFYVFAAGNLWFNGYLFFADMVVQPFFIAFIFVTLKVLKKEIITTPYFIALFLLSYFMVLTEWIGIFLGFCSSLLIFVNRKRTAGWPLAVGVIACGVILSLFTTFILYSSIDGMDSYLKTAFEKFLTRTGLANYSEGQLGFTNSESYKLLKKYNENSFGIAIKISAGLIIIYLLARHKLKLRFDSMFYSALFLCSIPVILHILVFFNFNIWHGFSVHKYGVLYALLPSLVLSCFNKAITKLRIYFNFSILLILLAYPYFSYSKFLKENNQYFSVTPQKFTGEKIKEFSDNCSAVFTNANSHCELYFYSLRSPMYMPNLSAARKKFNDYSFTNYGLFAKTNNEELEYIVKFNSSHDSILVWRR